MSDLVEEGIEPQVAEQPDTGAPDISAQLAALTERFDAFEGRLPQVEDQPAPTLRDGLYGAQEDTTELTPEDEAYLRAMYGNDEDGDFEEETEPVDSELIEHVGELTERLAAMENERIDREFDALTERYPDILSDSVKDKLRVEMQALAARYGEGVYDDARAVEMAYKAVKADAVAAAEQPAGSAASGAHLESGAGSSQQGESDPSKEYQDALLAGSGTSVFG